MNDLDDPRLKQLFLENNREHCRKIESLLDQIHGEYSTHKPTLMKAIKEAHSMKGSCGFEHFMELAFLACVLENIFIAVFDNRLKINKELAAEIKEALADCQESLDMIEREGKEKELNGFTMRLKELSGLNLDKLCQIPGKQ